VHLYEITCVYLLLCRYIDQCGFLHSSLSAVLRTSFILAYRRGSTHWFIVLNLQNNSSIVISALHRLRGDLHIASLHSLPRCSTVATLIQLTLCTILAVSHGHLKVFPVYEDPYLDYHGYISCHECCNHWGTGN
jgi:hypothetical protein